MDRGERCTECGIDGMERRFTPTSNIHIPASFRQWGTGGREGGGQYSWSDFHDQTERELAHAKDENGQPIEYMTQNEAMSKPGAGVKRDRAREISPLIDAAYMEAKQKAIGQGMEI